jgi:acyl-CoA thioesterase
MRHPEWPNQSSFSDLLGFELVLREDGLAKIRVNVEPRHANTVGIAHGGVLTSIMDTACGTAVAFQPSIGGKGVTTVSIQVSYLAPTFVGDTVTATARLRGRGRRILTVAVEAENQHGESLAIGLCTLRVRAGDGTIVASRD